MHVSRFVEALKADLAAVAELGDERTAETAGRLTVALQASVGLRLLDALTEAAVELNAQLPSGHVEVRLVGQDPQLVFVDEAEDTVAPPGDDALTARISLRLPEGLKRSIEAAAAREGVSLNTWLVRALARSTAPPARRTGNRLTGYGRN